MAPSDYIYSGLDFLLQDFFTFGPASLASSIILSAAGLVLCGVMWGLCGGCLGGLCLNQLIVHSFFYVALIVVFDLKKKLQLVEQAVIGSLPFD